MASLKMIYGKMSSGKMISSNVLADLNTAIEKITFQKSREDEYIEFLIKCLKTPLRHDGFVGDFYKSGHEDNILHKDNIFCMFGDLTIFESLIEMLNTKGFQFKKHCWTDDCRCQRNCNCIFETKHVGYEIFYVPIHIPIPIPIFKSE